MGKSKRGRHKSAGSDLNRSIRWLESLPNIKKVILGFSEACRHKYSPGHIKIKSDVDGGWESWNSEKYIKALSHPIVEAGFNADFDAMKWADTFVLVQPCGRSAHLEMGWAVGAGKATIMMLGTDIEPELMVKMCDHICIGLGQVLELFEMIEKG